MQPVFITARDNALVKQLRKLAHDPGAYRRQGQVWIEGDHLCRAALERGWRPAWAVVAASHWGQIPAAWYAGAQKIAVLDDNLFAQVSTLESPASMGFLLASEQLQQEPVQEAVNTVILDRIQDAGNVGSILRTASAMGFRQVLALKGTAALWSPKVLRAGMGAHFGLQLHEGLSVDEVLALRVPLLVTHLQGSTLLHQATLPSPCAWVLGHEGQGVQQVLVQQAGLLLRIAQPGGEESLNVGAAAAICLYASVAASLSGAQTQT